jgi:hypothetical protein
MMDVTVKRSFAASPSQVAAIMFDPRRDAEWIGGATSAEQLGGGGIGIGSRVRRHGGFLGRTFSWTTEVKEHVADRLLRMGVVEGPMRGSEVCYRVDPADSGSLVSIRNRGAASFSFPGMAWFLRRSVGKDLERLRRLVEIQVSGDPARRMD